MRLRSSVAIVAWLVTLATLARAGEPPTDDVVVRAPPRIKDTTDVTVSAAQARKLVGTEGDPIKAVENLPGVTRPPFGAGQLVVWGSTPNESRTYVDGVEIPNLFHDSAIRSTIQGGLVRSVALTPGAYGADYGRALGGMVRVETADLPEKGLHADVGADTLDGSALLSASLGDRVRVAVAGRYGWLAGLLDAIDVRDASSSSYFAIPRYADYQGKLHIALRPRESLDAVVLGSRDDLSIAIPSADPARARSQTTGQDFQRFYLRYRRVLDDGAAIDVVPFVGHDARVVDSAFGTKPASLDESTWRGGLRASLRTRVAKPLGLAFGVDVAGSSTRVARTGSLLVPSREGDPGVFGRPPGDDTASDTWVSGAIDVAPWVIAQLDTGPLSVVTGLRVDGFLLQTSRSTPRIGRTPPIGHAQLEGRVQPRVSARLRVNTSLSLVGAAGVYSQAPDPTDMSAVFGNPTLGVETADHVSLGESLRITPSLSLDAIGFYKWMSDLTVRDPSPAPRLAAALVQNGDGRAYGLQVILRQEPWEGFFGWVALTLSRSERRDGPDAAFRLSDFDQPAVLTMVAAKELQAWTFSVRFRYARGLPRTPVQGAFYDLNDDQAQPILGAQGSIRLPDFWQLDLRIDRRFLLGEHAKLLLYVEGLNVTNHANVEEYVYSGDFSRRGAVVGLPLLVMAGARVEL